MQDSLKPMCVRDLTNKLSAAVWIKLWEILLQFCLQFYFVLMNGSGLDTEENIKIKVYISLLYYYTFEEIEWGPIKQRNKNIWPY